MGASFPGVEGLKSRSAGLGLAPDAVGIVPYRTHWSELFPPLADDIMSSLATPNSLVEHVGSTAVPGLAAKPILDVAVGLMEPIDQAKVLTGLEGLGFEFQEDLGSLGGHFYSLESNRNLVVSHLHVVDVNDLQWHWYLAFRDGLRRDPQLCRDYADLKLRLASEYTLDRVGYTNAKSEWIRAVLAGLHDQTGEADRPPA